MNNAAFPGSMPGRRQIGPFLDVPAGRFVYRHSQGGTVAPSADRDALRAAFGARPRRLLRRHDPVYLQRETCRSLYMLDSGSVKACITMPGGTEHVLDFHLPGDVIGVDGMIGAEYRYSTIALEHTTVSTFALERLRIADAEQPALAGCVIAILAQEVSRERALRLRNHLDAEGRLCGFLVEWSRRLGELGYSSTQLRLPMSRIELGNYLGMTQETVSRMFTALRERGVVQARGRFVEILTPKRLQERFEAALAA